MNIDMHVFVRYQGVVSEHLSESRTEIRPMAYICVALFNAFPSCLAAYEETMDGRRAGGPRGISLVPICHPSGVGFVSIWGDGVKIWEEGM
jgi:hypothetical protein